MMRCSGVFIAIVALSACEKDSPPSQPAPAAPATRTPDAAPAVASWWETDKPCPEGAELKKNDSDRQFQCVKKDGTAHGPVVFLHDNGNKRQEGRYVDGKRDGIWSQWDKKGELLGTFSLSKGTGTVQEWFDNGDPQLEIMVVAGERSGAYREWYEGRKLRWQRAYESGAPVGGWQQWSRDGKLLGSLTFKDGSGKYIEWDDQGERTVQGAFHRGKHHGRWTWKWTVKSDKGEVPVEYRREYRDGVVVSLKMFKGGVEIRDGKEVKEVEATRRTGVLGALSAQPGGAFASLTGTGDFSSGLDDESVYGGLLGNEVGEMEGGFGFGVKGTGPGGGGTGWGTIGTGKYGTIGHGSGTKGSTARAPQVRIGNATATGDLDKNIIRRYIRRKLARIRGCYEKELVKDDKLSGTVVVHFTISATGDVLNASAKGLGNKAVESCVAATIRSIKFPKPKGGGLVNVRYPFTMRATGG